MKGPKKPEPRAKLDEQDVRNIKALIQMRKNMEIELQSISNKALAEKFGVHKMTIDAIMSGKIWKEVQ